jgi:aminomethyltransferase
MGIRPCQFATLDLVRIESSLLFFPYDNSQTYSFAHDPPGDSLWELGLDFTVSPRKTGFRGDAAHYRLKGKERFRIFGLLVEGRVPADPGDEVWADGRQVGVVTGAVYSTLTERSMAMARLDVPYAVQGTKLEIRGKTVNGPAIAHTLPFDDPEKKKRTAA